MERFEGKLKDASGNAVYGKADNLAVSVSGTGTA